ncbi:uncharacterized mitochondrial protein AtMg00810-like [Beta vulgaris subsp. vulgaris]|uniref:uncharacterized mitochondrial protein AtMg00810-like n=1 Tax=Beta vulgaris subsp. vulgaris TaxID=3555 RepID=UPI00203705F2|nr:uncharacterized mitochondrial protein AtMg00810-like [Beta vulgaris subsp. vulgaris]
MVRTHDGEFLVLLVYVDDILITGTPLSQIEEVKRSLDTAFTIKDLGNLTYFIGIEVLRTANGIFLSQKKYIKDILSDAAMLDCIAAPAPLSCGLPHLRVSLHILKYLKGTLDHGLWYKADDTDLQVTAYSDSDWSSCQFSSRSLSAYAVFLGSNMISWKTKKQHSVSKSSVEA